MSNNFDNAKKTLKMNAAVNRVKVDIAERLRERDVNIFGGFQEKSGGIDEM